MSYRWNTSISAHLSRRLGTPFDSLDRGIARGGVQDFAQRSSVETAGPALCRPDAKGEPMKLVVAVIKPFKPGQIEKGKIFILDLQSAVRIRTGETDAAAI